MDENTKRTDKQIEELEKRITEVYAQAEKEVQEKLDKHLAKFAEKDEKKQAQLKAGEITKAEYKSWRQGQIATGERWANLRDEMAKDLTRADVLAMSMSKGVLPEVFADSHNFGTFQIESKGVNTSYTLYDKDTVMRLIRDDPKLLPDKNVDIPKDLRWNKQHVSNAVTQGILQGESIPQISKRLERVVGMDRNSAMRNARTMVTSAQNAGRHESMKRAEEMGIPILKQWLSAHDKRVRASHQHLDGQEVPVKEEFSNGLMYPADPDGDPEEVYNCRCTIISDVDVENMKEDSPLRDDLYTDVEYDDWEESKILTHEIINRATKEEENVSNMLRASVNLTQGHLEGYDFRFKGAGSLERKIVEKSAKKGLSMKEYAKQITDALRYTNVSPPNSLTQDYLRIVENLEKNGYQMVEVVNTMADTTAPYRGINTLVQTPTGYVFELQFHTEQSIKIKEINHKLYEEERLASTPQERKDELNKQMAFNAQSITTPTNVSVIKDKFIDVISNL